ncbi:hypothetical protein DFJ73DRAFT_927996 [Zopfochytrium polystomum]|nr:hypothetical protein DFJ73DRAFT_927996 [Zopfochytrium polystomum]
MSPEMSAEQHHLQVHHPGGPQSPTVQTPRERPAIPYRSVHPHHHHHQEPFHFHPADYANRESIASHVPPHPHPEREKIWASAPGQALYHHHVPEYYGRPPPQRYPPYPNRSEWENDGNLNSEPRGWQDPRAKLHDPEAVNPAIAPYGAYRDPFHNEPYPPHEAFGEHPSWFRKTADHSAPAAVPAESLRLAPPTDGRAAPPPVLEPFSNCKTSEGCTQFYLTLTPTPSPSSNLAPSQKKPRPNKNQSTTTPRSPRTATLKRRASLSSASTDSSVEETGTESKAGRPRKAAATKAGGGSNGSKSERNREACRRMRERKRALVQSLREQVRQLTEENVSLKARVAEAEEERVERMRGEIEYLRR